MGPSLRNALRLGLLLTLLLIAAEGGILNPQANSNNMARPEEVAKAYKVQQSVTCDLCRVFTYEMWWKTANCRTENDYYKVLEERCHTAGNINPTLAADYWVDQDEEGLYWFRPKKPGYTGPSMQLDFRTRGVELACAELLSEFGEDFVVAARNLREEYATLTQGMNIPRRRHQDKIFLSRLHDAVCSQLPSRELCTEDPDMQKVSAHPGEFPLSYVQAEERAEAAEQERLKSFQTDPEEVKQHMARLHKARVSRQRKERAAQELQKEAPGKQSPQSTPVSVEVNVRKTNDEL